MNKGITTEEPSALPISNGMKRLVIITDTWHPKLDGIVRTTQQFKTELENRSWEVLVIHPGLFWSAPLPYYSELRVALMPGRKLARLVDNFKPAHVHIMSEGPLGLAARRLFLKRKWQFTTTYHTHLHLYAQVHLRGSSRPVARLLRWFHSAATKTFVSTKGLWSELEAQGFKNLVLCPLAVDTDLFRPIPGAEHREPIFSYFGRLAPEKSPEDFLALDLPGKKVVIGDGPLRASLEKKYGGNAQFLGYLRGPKLVAALSRSSVVVFTSRTETFGLVVLEALACGVPVAAYDVTGPRDIITNGVDGVLSDDLQSAALKCLTLDRNKCREKALQYSWEKSTEAFIANLVPIA